MIIATKKQKILLILFGIVASLLLLELGLRFSGWVYYSYRIKDRNIKLEKGDITKILCLGDSFTFGEGAPKGYSYPEQLEELLNRNNRHKKFQVYNAGIPGQNSSSLHKNLSANIEKNNPHIVIVMSGCNNNSNFKDSNYYLFIDGNFRKYL